MLDLQNKHVVLIDGSGYIYRAYYALPMMTRPSDGAPVNAVYGFCSMMMKLLKDMPADYRAVMFDASRRTFRMDIFPEYKATRRETPADLKTQFPLLREAVAAFDLAQVEVDGFEADDLLATYARLAREAGAKVTIVSADKDLMQLVGTGVDIFDPMKQRSVESEQVVEKFGVAPDKVVDVQALAGDASDNVPGVRGIGIKTAAALINEYGSPENLLDNLDSIKQNKRREALAADADNARMSKRLVTLDAFAPAEKALSDFAAVDPSVEKTAAFFGAMGFKSLVAKVSAGSAVSAPAVAQASGTPLPEKTESRLDYRLIRDLSDLQKQLQAARENGFVAIDTETDSLTPTRARLVGFSFCFEAGRAFYVPLRHKAKAAQTDLFGDAVDNQTNPRQRRFGGFDPSFD